MASPSLRWDHMSPRAPKAPEVLPSEWEQHRALLKSLYIDQNMTLEGVMKYMKAQCGFSPTKRQYTLRLRRWGYFKNYSHCRPQIVDEVSPGPVPTVEGGAQWTTHDFESVSTSLGNAEGQNQGDPDTSMSIESPEKPAPQAVDASLPAESVSITHLESSFPSNQTAEEAANVETAKVLSQTVNGLPELSSPEILKTLPIWDDELGTENLCISEVSVTDETSATSSASTISGRSTVRSTSQNMSSSSSLDHFEDLPYRHIVSPGCRTAEDVVQSSPWCEASAKEMPILSEEMFTKRYRASELLRNPNLTQTEFNTEDLDQIKAVADFFFAAQSFEDAFSLHGARWPQMTRQASVDLTSPSVLRLAIDMAKSATTLANYTHIARLMRDINLKPTEILPATSAEACLLHSHLGNCYRALKQLAAAEHQCRVGLYGYRQFPQPLQHIRDKVTLLTNLALVLEDRKKHLALEKSLKDIFPADLSAGNLVYSYIYGCSITLEDGHFNTALADVDDTLWDQAPLARDVTNLEMTMLFCYLWAQWQAEPTECSWRRSCLEKLGRETGISPTEALSALVALIVDLEPGSFEAGKACAPFTKPVRMVGRDLDELDKLARRKSTLALRVRMLCSNLSLFAPTDLFKAFLQAYAAPLRAKGSSFSTELYRSRVQEFVREFADSHFSLRFSERAAEDLRLRRKPDLAPSSPAFIPSMLSTPRSSWSDFASFKSTDRRVKQTNITFQLPTADGRRLSAGSSILRRRWSLRSSKTSLRSSIISLMDIEPEDIIMEEASCDDANSLA